MGGFHMCSPYCGRCKPPLPPARTCGVCGRVELDPIAFTCKECGALLPKVQKPAPIFCEQILQTCANPCGRGRKAVSGGLAGAKCPYHTPLIGN